MEASKQSTGTAIGSSVHGGHPPGRMGAGCRGGQGPRCMAQWGHVEGRSRGVGHGGRDLSLSSMARACSSKFLSILELGGGRQADGVAGAAAQIRRLGQRMLDPVQGRRGVDEAGVVGSRWRQCSCRRSPSLRAMQLERTSPTVIPPAGATVRTRRGCSWTFDSSWPGGWVTHPSEWAGQTGGKTRRNWESRGKDGAAEGA